jgi:hypothetical protein
MKLLILYRRRKIFNSFLKKIYYFVSPCVRFSVGKQVVIPVTKKFPELYEECLLSGHYKVSLKHILK